MPGEWRELLRDPTLAALKGRDFLSLADYTPTEVKRLLALAQAFKAAQGSGEQHRVLAGKTLGMLFTKASTRTRVSFEVGMWQLGGYPIFLNAQDLQLRRGEPVQDTARVLSRYVDGIMIRTFAHTEVTELARWASVPVMNGLTDHLHPCQALADYLTLYERWGGLRGRTVVYLGDGNNVAHSLMYAGAKLGVRVVICTPPGYEPDPQVVAEATQAAEQTGGTIEMSNNPQAAVEGADALYADVWASMGQEAEQAGRMQVFQGYQLNQELVAATGTDVTVLHCLPAHRGEEITDGVIEGPQAAIFDQAENRLHAQKAVMATIMRPE